MKNTNEIQNDMKIPGKEKKIRWTLVMYDAVIFAAVATLCWPFTTEMTSFFRWNCAACHTFGILYFFGQIYWKRLQSGVEIWRNSELHSHADHRWSCVFDLFFSGKCAPIQHITFWAAFVPGERGFAVCAGNPHGLPLVPTNAEIRIPGWDACLPKPFIWLRGSNRQWIRSIQKLKLRSSEPEMWA